MDKWDELNTILIETKSKDLLDILYLKTDWQSNMRDIIYDTAK